MKAIDPHAIWPIAAIVALVGSWIGTFVSGRIGFYFGKKHRGYLLCDFAVQSALIYLVAGLYYGDVLKLRDGRTEYAGILLMAISMGSQNVTVKGMGGPPTMPTQVATGAMADFFSDPRLFAPLKANRPRNERFVFVLTFVLGEESYRVKANDRWYHWWICVSILVAAACSHCVRDVQAAGDCWDCRLCSACFCEQGECVQGGMKTA